MAFDVFVGDRSGGRENHFNLIRMAAAIGVLVSHAYPLSLGPDGVPPLKAWLHGMSLGGLSVHVFFAISGFFVTQSIVRNPSIVRFLLARFLRLYPALFFVLLLTIVFAGLVLTTAPPDQFWSSAGSYMKDNLLLHSLQYELPGVFSNNPYNPAINGSLWTLYFEVLCYGCVLIAGVVGLFRRPKLFAVLLVVVVVVRCALPALDVTFTEKLFIELSFPFALGAALYIWRAHVPLSVGVGAALAGIALAAWFTPVFQPVFVVALSYWVFLLGLAPAKPLLAYNAVGDYSYGMYIYAFPMQQLVASQGAVTPLINMVLALPLTLVCAVLSWHLVEKPALSLLHRREARAVRAPT